MDQTHQKQIDKLKSKVSCQWGFECIASDFNVKPKTKDSGINSFVECLSKDAHRCKFSVPFGGMYFCQGPIAVYVTKNVRQ